MESEKVGADLACTSAKCSRQIGAVSAAKTARPASEKACLIATPLKMQLQRVARQPKARESDDDQRQV
jgi:hypothetical protein